jgi:hypothetical protein
MEDKICPFCDEPMEADWLGGEGDWIWWECICGYGESCD